MNQLSPDFFAIRCPHFSVCSGCSIDEDVDQPMVFLEMSEWFRNNQILSFILHTQAAKGWRMRAKLAVRGNHEQPAIGLYESGTHRVVPIPRCKAHHPLINEGVSRIEGWIRKHQVQIYQEKVGRGHLRYLQLIVEKSSGRVHATFVLNLSPDHWPSGDSDALLQWQKNLAELWGNGEFWHSFSINFNTRRDNVILGTQWHHCFGEPFLWERFLGVEVCFHPSSFAQANSDQFEHLLRSLHQWVPESSTIAEYYAGVGVIGLTLAEKSGSISCCEINKQAKICFEHSKNRLGEPSKNKISWFPGASSSYAGWLETADVAIIDPPRKGVEKPFLEALAKGGAVKRLIYVSCGWESFKKDAEALLSAGWKIAEAEGHLFFPGSNHVETLVLFVKK